jgi:MFS superfamily sulfate permease-like transporter
VVFLVAVPLCVGVAVAVASGVPAEPGLVTGIVGGLFTGLLPGSSLRVSGPAAGLTVLVYEAVRAYGLGALGVLVLAASLLQRVMGALRLGRWFRAVSVSVVQGMLAGVGLVLIAGRLYAMADAQAPAGGLAKLGGLPRLAVDTFGSPASMSAPAIGAGTLPAPLAAVAAATAATVALDPPVARIWDTSHVHLEVSGLSEESGPVRVRVVGNATFLRLPRLLDELESLPRGRAVELDLTGLRHLDHACRTALTGWAERHDGEGAVPVRMPA